MTEVIEKGRKYERKECESEEANKYERKKIRKGRFRAIE